ncbi:MAG: AAA domain-containing protein [Streptosporangiaceae bacterium]
MVVDRPRWLAEAIASAERSAGHGGGPGRIGPAKARGQGWFEVSLLGVRYDPDLAAESYLADESGQRRYALRASVLDGGTTLRVRVAEHAPREGLVLCVMREHDLAEALAERLRAMTLTPLAEAFGRGTVDRSGVWAAGPSSGLSAVSAPPGPGKIELVARIIEDLLARGRSVLLVSGTNVSVDHAVRTAADLVSPERGVIVRVGTPHLSVVADDERICLNRLRDGMLTELDLRATALSGEILELGRPTRLTEKSRHAHVEIARLRTELAAGWQRYAERRAEETRQAGECLRLEAELSALGGVLGRLRNFTERQDLELELLAAQRRADLTDEECEALERELRTRTEETEHRISDLKPSFDPDEVELSRTHREAEIAHTSCEAERTLPVRHGQLELEAAYEELMAERRHAAEEASRRIIAQARVVATTHALLRLRDTGSYDFVIVDDAASATRGEVLYALSHGGEGAILMTGP